MRGSAVQPLFVSASQHASASMAFAASMFCTRLPLFRVSSATATPIVARRSSFTNHTPPKPGTAISLNARTAAPTPSVRTRRSRLRVSGPSKPHDIVDDLLPASLFISRPLRACALAPWFYCTPERHQKLVKLAFGRPWKTSASRPRIERPHNEDLQMQDVLVT